MKISNKKACYPWIYEKEAFNNRLIQEYVRKIKFYITKGKISTANPFDGIHEAFSSDATRDMRDFNKFLELMPSYALFKLFQHPIITIGEHRYLIPTIQDALDAKEAFDSILETTRSGTDARVLEFYHTILSKKVNGCDAETLTDEYNKGRKHPISVTRIRALLQRLQEIGWADIREGTHENVKGYIDRRYNSYLPLKQKETLITLNSGSSVLLKEILENSFKTWLENTLAENTTPSIIILNIDGTARQITVEEMISIINKKRECSIDECILKEDSKPKEEKKVESTLIPETSVPTHISTLNAIGESETDKVKDNSKKTLYAKRIKREPGVLCQAEGIGGPCPLEATWNITGNLYCEDHFKTSKKDCEDNGFAVELAKEEVS